MREIKFRAWWPKDKKMESWKEMWCDTPVSHFELYFDGAPSPVLMQFTGLKDKNGKEIYEGDVVKRVWSKVVRGELKNYEGAPQVVEWGEVGHEATAGWGFQMEKPESLVVIGNIYSNPELLIEKSV